ncbi:MAG: cell division protein FtsZ [Candidatus Diapherotrites archaeon]|nr:cell division protein FtsZ [Candidatus Diapherotrites archaeon]
MKSILENTLNKNKIESEPKMIDNSELNILVVGAGGGGCNTINRFASRGIKGAKLIAVNTDKQHLAIVNDSVTKILIGEGLTRGLGAGGYPEIGHKAAEVSKSKLEEALSGVDMLFLTAGMGGGTGTGSAPTIAKIAKEQGAIVISVVTYPFSLERARILKADEGIQKLSEIADTVIVIDNNRLVELVPNLPIRDAFKVADEVTARAVTGITETITQPSLINLDFADVKAIMGNRGLSMIAVGESKSVNKVDEVVKDTLHNTLLDVDISGASGALIHITGGPELTLGEANEIGERLTEQTDANATVIWGARIDPTYGSKIEAIAVFTGVSSPYLAGRKGSKKVGSEKYGLQRDSEMGLAFA